MSMQKMSDINDILHLKLGNHHNHPPGNKSTDNLFEKNTETKWQSVPDVSNVDGPYLSVSHKAQNIFFGALLPPSYGGDKSKLDPRFKKAKKWQWTPFTNPARADNAVFHHWSPTSEFQERQDMYPFAAFNKKLEIHDYSDAEYAAHLDSYTGWTKDATDHLFDLCRRFDLRFPVIHDRWDRNSHGQKSIEDLKDRYYKVDEIMTKLRAGPEKAFPNYKCDAKHEKRRKIQLEKLWARTPEEIQEEQHLKAEMKKINKAKKSMCGGETSSDLERQLKVKELQKMIDAQRNSDYFNVKVKVETNSQEI